MKIFVALRDFVANYRSNRIRRFGTELVATIALLVIVIVVSSSLDSMPDMKSIEDSSERKATFFGYLAPIAETLNQDILEQRAKLQEIADGYRDEQELSFFAEYRLKSIAQDFAVDWQENDPAAVLAQLELRVDSVPASLLLVQAAKESGWGTSRFAREGNNLFGQWCYSEGCGLVPQNRNSGAKHEVQVFDSVEGSIRAYLHNLNTGDAYTSLRDIRAMQRKAGKEPDGKTLADGLLNYSERREAYVQEVKAMLDQYHEFQQHSG